jgi:surfeit locus 1 family protein
MKLPIGATVMTVCCVAILASLGTWQVKRLEWKNDIIGRLNAQYERAEKSSILGTKALDDLALEKDPMTYGSIQARLLRDKSILLGPRIEEGRAGYHLLIPAAMADGHTLIVNAGWVSDLWQDNLEDRLSSLPGDKITLRGILHRPDWPWIASKNSPSNDLWFRADIGEIAAAKDLKNLYPYVLYVDHADPTLYDVKPHEDRWLPRNKHLQYALFWYALALAMTGVYGFYVRGLNKLPKD